MAVVLLQNNKASLSPEQLAPVGHQREGEHRDHDRWLQDPTEPAAAQRLRRHLGHVRSHPGRSADWGEHLSGGKVWLVAALIVTNSR